MEIRIQTRRDSLGMLRLIFTSFICNLSECNNITFGGSHVLCLLGKAFSSFCSFLRLCDLFIAIILYVDAVNAGQMGGVSSNLN